ncbi:glycosyltransferase [Puniceibacterium sp. IMCC21224]|uniref:glycosyltransferase family 2 protein n=1 Tax=Puniceibacterium sp. IMCC21224 TaxID=1618204 RepID=UPI00064D943C|nr:glycosyltransferase [Puniceibacterium sp. IMCC21224]KMK63826.1 Glycosyl transferase family 2 [Puniceibacterium sp. IMCC21224]
MSQFAQSDAVPQVSVVCAWYNRADYVRDTLDSLLAQDHPNFEVVLVNDGSRDSKVREILDSYTDPRLRMIHGANRGFTAAIAHAVDQARGAYVAVQGAGDVSHPARLRLQAGALAADQGLVGVGCARENHVIGGARDGERRTVGHTRTRVTTQHLLTEVGCPVNHGDVMFRRDAYMACGGYRPFFRLAQDWDLWIRMSAAGDFALLDEVLYERRVFMADGIASRVDKSLTQARYGRIAKSCFAERKRYGVDIVDLFGLDAGLYLPPDRFMADETAKTAVKYIRAGAFADGTLLADLARREALTARVILAQAVTWLCRTARGRRWVLALAAKIPMKDRRAILSLLPAENS